MDSFVPHDRKQTNNPKGEIMQGSHHIEKIGGRGDTRKVMKREEHEALSKEPKPRPTRQQHRSQANHIGPTDFKM